MAGVSGLLARDLVVVTGKGGVGKSTVAGALGLVAARRGLRTIVAEVSARDDVSRALGGEAAEHEEELLPGLHHISVDPQTAMEEYLVDQLPSRALADLLTSSRTFTYLTATTPVRAGSVSEALDLERVLQAELAVAVELFVVNGLLPDRFTDADARALATAASGDAVRAALAAHERARSQRLELSRLRRHGRAPVATLPFLFDAVPSPDRLGALADRLERVL